MTASWRTATSCAWVPDTARLATIPANLTRKAYIENVRFYFAADNLFTITGYKGVDPEFSRANVLNTGIDKLIYPFTRIALRSARKSPF